MTRVRTFSGLRLYRLLPLGALLVIALIPLWCAQDSVPSVQPVVAHRRPLRVEVTTNGTVEPLKEAETELRARLGGRIVSIPDPGTYVEEGAEVLRIDDGPVAAQLAAAQSDRLAAIESLRSAQHTLLIAKERFSTDHHLFNEGALTRQRYAESHAALRDAEARVANLEREVPLRVASLDLQIEELVSQKTAAIVTAPFSGTVYRTEAKQDEIIRAGDPILWIVDLDQLRVRANVDQVDLGRVKEGQRVRIMSNAYAGRSWSGQVSEVIPHVIIKENRSVSESLATLDPPTDGLVPGMTVDVEIIVAEADDALQIPAVAVLRRGDDSFVYRLEGRRVRQVPVQLGLENAVTVQVTHGLEEGDVVATGPLPELKDGMRVDAAGTQ